MAGFELTARTKRSADTVLMPPPSLPTKRQKRPKTILDEDVYHEAVSHIVARDFFPGLLESAAQEEYLRALDSENTRWIREAGKKLTQVMTPVSNGRRRMSRAAGFTPRRNVSLGDTPRGCAGETPTGAPRAEANDHFAPDTKPDVDVDMSLSAFQTKYTSEDNESFNALLDKQNNKNVESYAFFHQGNQIPSTRQLAHRASEKKLLEDLAASSSSLIVRNAVGEERKAVASSAPSEDLDARLATVESFRDRQGPRNHLMFGPEGVEDTHETYAQRAEERSSAPPKSVAYSATRFSLVNTTSDQVPIPSPSLTAVDAAIAGRPRDTQSEFASSGADTPRVNGYAFVDAEPTPSELGIPVPEEEVIAAEREAAMKLLPQLEDGGPNPFQIKARSKRERVHHNLVEKADAARRKERGGNRLDQLRSLGVTGVSPHGRTPTPKFASAPSGKKTPMTLAAQRLAGRLKTPSRENSVFGSKKSMMWDSTPRVKKIA